MQQQISVITLGVEDLARSRDFYRKGFGWESVFDNGEIIFYQMNGFVFGTWLRASLDDDTQRPSLRGPGSFALAHNVGSKDHVNPLIERLVAAGAALLRDADVPPQGGFRGYVADPDGHAWEIAWNPVWPINEHGHVTFAI